MSLIGKTIAKRISTASADVHTVEVKRMLREVSAVVRHVFCVIARFRALNSVLVSNAADSYGGESDMSDRAIYDRSPLATGSSRVVTDCAMLNRFDERCWFRSRSGLRHDPGVSMRWLLLDCSLTQLLTQLTSYKTNRPTDRQPQCE
ncbi:unnamed protein product [Soboliphyme baturini]|uniref:Uncharacterized protein n=1 Tax=Soboliphyme baturini TaxID=241478 RepID=A0A183IFF1_9BILA|nr:unnamed protein product [Soboliphyme baturini]